MPCNNAGWNVRDETRGLTMRVRIALARLRRHPSASAVIAISLALGIAANTLMFSAYRAFLNPKHFVDINRQFRVFESERGQLSSVSAPNYREIRQRQRSLGALAAFAERVFNISGGSHQPELIDGVLMTQDLFRVLGVQPVMGRAFAEEELHSGGPGAVVVSHTFWQSRFAGRSDALGQSVAVDGDLREIVGVMPRGFHFAWSADVWVPWTSPDTDNQRLRNLRVIGRLSPNSTVQGAEAELSEIVARAESQRSISLMPLEETLSGGGAMRGSIELVLLASAFVLLIAGLNVSSLHSVDALSRQRDTATRIALGASRTEVVRHFLTESVVVAMAGGVLGVAGAYWGITYITMKLASDIPYWMEIRLDGPGLLYSFVLSVFAGIVSGLHPALQASRTPHRALQEGPTGSRRTANLVRLLVLGQVAAAVVLLFGTKAAIDAIQTLETRDLGYHLDGKLTVSVPLLSDRYAADEFKQHATSQILERSRALPGVKRVAAVSPMPLRDSWRTISLRLPGGHLGSSDAERVSALDYACTSEYFAVMGISLLAGEAFRGPGPSTFRREIILNRTLSRLVSGNDPSEAIGRIIPISDAPHRVIGVVEDSYHTHTASTPTPAIYRTLAAVPRQRFSIILASDTPAEALQVPVREVIGEFDAALAVSDVSTMQALLAESLSKFRATTYMLGAVSLLALVLALTGIYGIAAASVAWRARELAIRRALGSSNADVIALVLGQVARLTLIGLLLGTAFSYPLIGLLKSALYGVEEFPFTSHVAVWLSVGATSLLTASVPVLRSVRAKPFEVLSE